MPSLRERRQRRQGLQPVMADLTLEEAAASLGVAASTLRVQLHKGKLKGKKVGPVWVLTPKEVERYRRESKR